MNHINILCDRLNERKKLLKQIYEYKKWYIAIFDFDSWMGSVRVKL